MVQRTAYLNQLIAHCEQKVIKVVTGVRRCGKSTLFSLFQEHLRSTGVGEDQLVSVDLEALEFEELLDYRALYRYVKERLCDGRFTYVFIDEVHNCPAFEKAVDSLFIKDHVDVYITGSNAYMLSGELATLLSGRSITIDMLPFSFKEYCEAVQGSGKTTGQLLNEYLTLGSFPHAATLERRAERVAPYLEGIYNTILIKDVARREGITDVTLLESIVKTLASSIGSPISIKKITDTLVSAGRKISMNTVERYVRGLTDSYIFYKVDRYDIKGRQHLKTLGKYYMVDTGIRQFLLSQRGSDLGHLIENVVYLELRRRGYRVNIGKLAQQEVDFVVSGADGMQYFQVAASVLEEGTLRRELTPLEKITDNYPKVLLTLDEIGNGADHNGIRQLNLLEWLLQ